MGGGLSRFRKKKALGVEDQGGGGEGEEEDKFAERLKEIEELERNLEQRRLELDEREEMLNNRAGDSGPRAGSHEDQGVHDVPAVDQRQTTSALSDSGPGPGPGPSPSPGPSHGTGALQDAAADRATPIRKGGGRGRRKSMFFVEPEASDEAAARPDPEIADDAVQQQQQQQQQHPSEVSGVGGGDGLRESVVKAKREQLRPPEPRPRASLPPLHLIEQRCLRVFVYSSLPGGSEHAMLRSIVYPRLMSDAARRGVTLRMVDLRDEMLKEHEEKMFSTDEGAALLLDQLLYEAGRCLPLSVGLLGESYLDGIGDEMVAALEGMGQAWVRDDGAGGARGPVGEACATDLIVRRAALMSRDGWAMVLLLREKNKTGGAAAGEAKLLNAEHCSAKAVQDAAKRIEAESSTRGRIGELEASIVRNKVATLVSPTGARLVESVYAEVRGVVDVMFPADEPLASKNSEVVGNISGWLPAIGEGFNPESSAMRREEKASIAYQDMCDAACIEPSERLLDALAQYCGLGSSSGIAASVPPGTMPTKVLAILDENPEAPCVSASLAVWAKRVASKPKQGGNNSLVVVYHKIGLVRGPCKISREAWIIIGAIKRRCGLLAPLPDEASAHEQLGEWLATAGRSNKLILVIDGLDHVTEGAGSVTQKLFEWLPAKLPLGCSIVLGVGDDRKTEFKTSKLASKWKLGSKINKKEQEGGEDAEHGIRPVSAAEIPRALSTSSQQEGTIGDRLVSPRDSLSITEQENFSFLTLPFTSLKSRALLMRRLHSSLSPVDPASLNGGANVAFDQDWAERAASVLGINGLQQIIVVSMVLARHGNLFRSPSLRAHSTSGAGQVQVSTCDAWPYDTSVEVLCKAFDHIKGILSARGVRDGAVGDALLLLADCYCGIDEHRLELALGLSALHFSILLRELSPYLMSASGIFYLSDQVRQAALKHFAESQPLDPHNPFLMKPEAGRAFVRHDEVLVAEALFKVEARGDQATRTLVTDASFFVAAHHSTYRTRFRLAWSSVASDDVGGDMAAELRSSAERYGAPIGSDGVAFESASLAQEVSMCHKLMVARFLSTHAAQPGQALKLLNDLRPLTAQGAACKRFRVALSAEIAVAHRQNGDASEGIKVIKEALSQDPLFVASDDLDDEARVQDWRDRAYVAGFLKNAQVAGVRLLGEMHHALGNLKEAEHAYGQLLEELNDACTVSARAELSLGKALWAAAKLSKDCGAIPKARQRSSGAQRRLLKQLHAEHTLCKEVNEFVALLERRSHQADISGEDVEALLGQQALLKDLGNQDKDSLDDVKAGDEGQIEQMKREFEVLYSKSKYVMAHRTALKLLLTVEAAAAQTGQREEEWCDAAMMLAKVLARRGLYDQSIALLDSVIEAESSRLDSDSSVRLVVPRLEQCIVRMEQGDYEKALDTIKRFASWNLPEMLGADHPVVARMSYVQANMLVAQGAVTEALELFRVVKQSNKLAGSSLEASDHILATLCREVELMIGMSMYEDAGEALKEYVEAVEKTAGNGSMAMAEAKYLEGVMLLQFGDNKGCDDVLRDAAKIASMCVGKPQGEDKRVRIHPLVLKCSWRIADKSYRQGRYEESRNIYDTVVKGFFATHVKNETSLTVAEIKEGYACLCEKLGKPQQASELIAEVMEMRQLVPGMRPEALVHISLLTAQQEIHMGDFRAAQATVDSTLAILETASHNSLEDKGLLAHVGAQLAFQRAADVKTADELYREAISVRQILFGNLHPSVALLQIEHAYILMEMKDFEGAEDLLKDASSSLLLAYGKASAHMSAVHRVQGLIYRDSGQYEKAEYVLQDALLVDASKEWATPFLAGDYSKAPVPRTVQVLDDLEALGRVQYRRGNFDAADHIVKHVHSLSISLYGEMSQHPTIARSLVAMSDLRVEYGDYQQAEALCKNGLDIQKRVLSAKHPHTLRTMGQYCKILELCGDCDGASSVLMEIKDGLTVIHGQEHLQVRLAEARLAMMQYAMGIQKRPRSALVAALSLIENKIFRAPAAAVAAGFGRRTSTVANLSADGGKLGGMTRKGGKDAGGGAALGGAGGGKDAAQLSPLERERAQIFLWLAECDIDAFKVVRASRFLRMAEVIYKKMGKVGEPMIGVCKTRHADIAYLRGRLSLAMNMYKQASAAKKRTFWGAQHPELFEDEQGIARVLLGKGRYDEAGERFEKALELTENCLASRNSKRAGTMIMISELLETIGRYDEAEEMLENSKSLQVGFTNRSKAHVISLYRQGSLFVKRGLYGQAKQCMEQVVSIGQLHTACKDALRCSVLCEVGFAELGLRHFDKASDALHAAKQALDAAHAILPGNSSKAEKKQMLHNILARAKRYSKATKLFIEVIIPHAWKQQRDWGLYPIRTRLMLLEAKIGVESGQLDKAETTLRRIIDVYTADEAQESKAKQGAAHPAIAECQSFLAQVAYARGEFPESEALFQKAKAGKWSGSWEGTNVSHAVDADGLARIASIFARYEEASRLCKEARSILEAAALGEATPDVVSIDLFAASLALERGQYDLVPDKDDSSIVDEARKLSLLRQHFLLDKIGGGDKVTRDKVFATVAAVSSMRIYKALEIVVDHGSKEANLFIVGSGALSVCPPMSLDHTVQSHVEQRPDQMVNQEVARLNTGDSVGEASLLLGEPWPASLVAVSPGEALCVPLKGMAMIFKGIEGSIDVVAGALANDERVWNLKASISNAGADPGLSAQAPAPPSVPELVAKIRKVYKMPAAPKAGGGAAAAGSRARGRRGSFAFDINASLVGSSSSSAAPNARKRRSSIIGIQEQMIQEQIEGPSPMELLTSSIQICGQGSLLTAEALFISGLACSGRFAWTAAVDLLAQAQEAVSLNHFGCWHLIPGNVTAAYARALAALGRRSEASELLATAVETTEKLLTSSHHSMLPLCAASARLYLDSGETAASLDWSNRALSLARKVHGPAGPHVAEFSTLVAMAEAMRGAPVEAIDKLTRVKDQKLRGGWHAACDSVVEGIEGRASALVICCRFVEAELDLSSVAHVRGANARKGAAASVAEMTVQGVRVRMLLQQGRIEEAVSVSRRLIDAEAKNEGEVMNMDALLIEARRALAEYKHLTGDASECSNNVEQACKLCDVRFSKAHPTYISTLMQRARLRAKNHARDRKRLAEEEEAIAAAGALLVSSQGEGHYVTCEIQMASAAVHDAYYRYTAAEGCIEAAMQQYRALSRGGGRGNQDFIDNAVEAGEEMSFAVATCNLELAKLQSNMGFYSRALETLMEFYRACDELFQASEMLRGSSPSQDSTGMPRGSSTTEDTFLITSRSNYAPPSARYFGGPSLHGGITAIDEGEAGVQQVEPAAVSPIAVTLSPMARNNSSPLRQQPGMLLAKTTLSADDGAQNRSPPQSAAAPRPFNKMALALPVRKAVDLRLHVPTSFAWLHSVAVDDFDDEDKQPLSSLRFLETSPLQSSRRDATKMSSMRDMTSVRQRSGNQMSSPKRRVMGNSSPVSKSRAGSRSPIASHRTGALPRQPTSLRNHSLRDMNNSTLADYRSKNVSSEEEHAIVKTDMEGGGGGEAGELWAEIITDSVNWEIVNFATPRLTEIEGLHCQAKLLLRMCRYGDAFCTLLALEHGLSDLNLTRHPYVRECEVFKAQCLLGAGKYEEANAMFEFLLPLSPEQRSEDPMSGHLLKGAASVKEIMLDMSRAAVLYKQAASQFAEAAGTSDMPDVHECELHALRVRWHAGLLSDPYPRMKRHIESLERLLGKDHPSVSVCLVDYADILVRDKEYDSCESLYRKAHQALEERCGTDHPLTARTVASLAMLHHLVGPSSKHYDTVVPSMQGALDTMVQRLGRKHAALFPILNNFATVCTGRGDHAKAEELRIWSISVLSTTHGPDHALVLEEKEKLVDSLMAQDKVQGAREMYSSLIEGRERSKGADSIELCPLLVLMSKLEMKEMQYQAAEKHLLRSLAIKQRHTSQATNMNRTAIPRQSDKQKEAAPYSVDCVPELLGLAEVSCVTEEFKDSEKYYISCIKAQKQEVEVALREFAKVEGKHEHQIRAATKRAQDSKIAVAETKRQLSSMFAVKGDLADAELWGKQALAEVSGVLGPEHPRSLAIRAILAGCYRAQEEHVHAQRLYIDFT